MDNGPGTLEEQLEALLEKWRRSHGGIYTLEGRAILHACTEQVENVLQREGYRFRAIQCGGGTAVLNAIHREESE